MTLFDFRDLPGSDRRGYRLQRLELLNWGTFDKVVWSLDLAGATTLVTGQIGSGKSTLVDAVSTLLLRPGRINYNKAAGSESRERSLRSYVLGYHKSERLDETTTKQVGLRSGSSYSVILGIFANESLGETASLAQVYWTKDGDPGQPERCYVTATRPLSIARDFADFGSDMNALKRRLRADGAEVFDNYRAYGEKMRRLIGVPSEQAMELFHQTVSLKSVGDLNEFVREHMLEPFDVDRRINDMVRHFADLTRAHDAVVRARHQLELLAPIVKNLDTHAANEARRREALSLRLALPAYLAQRTLDLLEHQIREIDGQIGQLTAEQLTCRDEVAALRERQQRLALERAGAGGQRLTAIEQALTVAAQRRDDALARSERLAGLLEALGHSPVDSAADFESLARQLDSDLAQLEANSMTARQEADQLGAERVKVGAQVAELNDEIGSLRSRRSSIPAKQLALRARLTAAINVSADELPFAGELIQVRAGSEQWEGAAERVLHGFALSILVPEEHYPAVSDWVDANHLGGRIVYFRVPARVGVAPRGADGDGERLRDHLDLKESQFARWLDAELERRADHACARTMTEFRAAAKAVTRAGQVKSPGGRHEKDDRHRIDDRSTYVLGWSNERKIAALTAILDQSSARLTELDERLGELQRADRRAVVRRDSIMKAREYSEFHEIDWRTPAGEITRLEDEKAQIEGASRQLRDITRQLDEVSNDIDTKDHHLDEIHRRLGALDSQRAAAASEREDARHTVEAPEAATHRPHFEKLDDRLESRPDSLRAWREAGRSIEGQLSKQELNAHERLQRLTGSIVGAMKEFRHHYPQDVADWTDDVASGPEYRALDARLQADDLPRFEAEFKTYLNTNTVREIAGFQSTLNKQRDEIKARIARINLSLESIQYNEGRYIRLECFTAANRDVTDFIRDLNACTEAALDGEDAYDESRFLRVKDIIDRLAGREGFTDIDRAWRRRVTDVRNWFAFSASERWRETDEEFETYTSSDGKSGGQKEKLAYTVLAASLAYQFKLDWDEPVSKSFSFVVIDEAFGRGDDESTRYALDLFERMGLQLMIVTPLQKIHIIEPYVAAVGFVENPHGDSSRLHSVTISEFQAMREAHRVALVEAGG